MTDSDPKIPLKQEFLIVRDKICFRRRRVFLLRTLGYSNEEISHHLGYSLSTVEKDIHALTESLRRDSIDNGNFLSKNVNYRSVIYE